MFSVTRESATDVFAEVCYLVMNYGEEVESRIGKTKHLTNITLVLTNPKNNMVNTGWRKTSKKYIDAEFKWYKSCDRNVSWIGQYAKTWNMIADKDGNVNSNYGHLIHKKFGFDQFEYCFEKLNKDLHDRQAIIHFKWANSGEEFGLDTPCTIMMQFTVFNNKLEAHTYMRSNDAFYGYCNDVVWFTYLQMEMYNRLKEKWTDLELGSYYHTVGDFHIYEKDWKKIPAVIND